MNSPQVAAPALLDEIVNCPLYPIDNISYQERCRQEIDKQGVLVLPDFLTPHAIAQIAQDGHRCQPAAFYTVKDHNVYLLPSDPALADSHPRNRLVSSSKGCITTDQIPSESSLRTLYDSALFKAFLCAVLDVTELHEYADSLSSINLHFAGRNQELGWHFDNSSFAITLLIQKPDAGGSFEYIKNVRDADRGDMNFSQVEKILDNNMPVNTLSMEAGTLVLFRGRNSLHRVTPTQGETTRMLAVLAYNTEPDIALSESARMTFYGRLA
ncbi:MAG: hypothetical protein AB8B64_06540 [Granulosicoccus sp.]